MIGFMAMGGCKLHDSNDYENLMKRYMNNYDEVTMGDTKDAILYTMGGATFTPSDVKELNIDWVSDAVTIEAYDGTEVVISETSNRALTDSTTMHYYLAPDGTLHIRFGIPGLRKRANSLPDKQLLVRVPRSMRLGKVEVNGVGQSVRMDSVLCHAVEINSVSRQIKLNECEIDEIEVNGVSVNLEATFSKMPKEMELNNVSGTVVLYVPEDAGIALEAAGVVSDFSTELPVVNKGKKKIIGNGACKIESNFVHGELHIGVKK